MAAITLNCSEPTPPASPTSAEASPAKLSACEAQGKFDSVMRRALERGGDENLAQMQPNKSRARQSSVVASNDRQAAAANGKAGCKKVASDPVKDDANEENPPALIPLSIAVDLSDLKVSPSEEKPAAAPDAPSPADNKKDANVPVGLLSQAPGCIIFQQQPKTPNVAPNMTGDPLKIQSPNRSESPELQNPVTSRDQTASTQIAKPAESKQNSANVPEQNPSAGNSSFLTAITEGVLAPESTESATAEKDSSLSRVIAPTAEKNSVLNKPPKLTAESTSSRATEALGISAAQMEVQMKKVEKAAKNAGSTQQELPSEANTAQASNLPAEAKRSVEFSAPADRIESASVITFAPAHTEKAADLSQFASSVSASDRIERTQETILSHAVRLRESAPDSLRVVIRPTEGVQLSLDLQKQGGAIQAHASLQRGDFELLRAHWPALQHRLEAHGVQLAPLARENNFSASSNLADANSQRNFQYQSSDEQGERNALLEGASKIAPVTLTTPPPDTRHASLARGWESWA